ncbi:MAG: FmdB family zinc ribbon protein [Candidatus Omnitrophota bacterium]
MPTYEYCCDTCGYTFEQFQKMEDAPLKKCPRCKAPVRRLIGMGAGVIFKGSGFYQTDYKKSGAKNDPKSSKEAKNPAPCGKTEACSCCDA